MGHEHALPKIAVALGDMQIYLKRYEIDVILSIRSCGHGWESIMMQSCFRCSRLIQRWPCLSLCKVNCCIPCFHTTLSCVPSSRKSLLTTFGICSAKMDTSECSTLALLRCYYLVLMMNFNKQHRSCCRCRFIAHTADLSAWEGHKGPLADKSAVRQ